MFIIFEWRVQQLSRTTRHRELCRCGLFSAAGLILMVSIIVQQNEITQDPISIRAMRKAYDQLEL